MTIERREIANLRRSSYNDVMRISPAKSILGLLLTIIFFNACSPNRNGNSNTLSPNSSRNAAVLTGETVVQDDLETLAKIIKLPFAPDEATFSETDQNGKKLVAVLKFSPADAAAIAAVAEKHQPPVVADIDAEMWFPPELIAKSQETGDEFLKGIAYAPNDFLQAPYINGKLTRLNDTNYFILDLTSF